MIEISPALLNDLQKVLKTYGYNFKHSTINNINKDKEVQRFTFSNESINLILKIKKK